MDEVVFLGIGLAMSVFGLATSLYILLHALTRLFRPRSSVARVIAVSTRDGIDLLPYKPDA